MTKRLSLAALMALIACLVIPSIAEAQGPGTANLKTQVDTLWVIVSCVLVLFMQAGFLFLEIGFSRQKNVGSGVAKILVNLGIATIAWWAVGYGIAGFGNEFFGTDGFLFQFGQDIDGVKVGGSDTALMLFGMLFCAVSLAIVWGTTLERIKFGAYVIYATVFAAVIYPLVAHGVYGGGLLAGEITGGKPVMDFAGSSVVHLTGAVGAFAALLLLGARKGKYGADGKPRAIPGHSMPLAGLGVLILWVGWYGFNAGSTFGTGGGELFAQVALNTQLAAAAGALAAMATIYAKTKALDVGMAGNGAIAGLVAITAPSGYVEFQFAPVIGAIGGIIVVLGILAIDKKLDDPVGALSAHGLAGIWGTLSLGFFASERLILDGASPGIWYAIFGDASFGATVGQLGVQAVGVALIFVLVFGLSIATFAAIKATIGLRVSEEEEEAGLDIVSHGMYGYPEQFIPAEEFGFASKVSKPNDTAPTETRPVPSATTPPTPSQA